MSVSGALVEKNLHRRSCLLERGEQLKMYQLNLKTVVLEALKVRRDECRICFSVVRKIVYQACVVHKAVGVRYD